MSVFRIKTIAGFVVNCPYCFVSYWDETRPPTRCIICHKRLLSKNIKKFNDMKVSE